MLVAHLLASPFYGGPERQVLALANELRGRHDSLFLSFAEGGRAKAFLDEAKDCGFEAIELRENWPHIFRAGREVAEHLREHGANILCTSGYKPDILGLRAARLTGIPAVAIAHGWTGATWKVRLNELLDRWAMTKYDAVVGVSEMQSARVRRACVAAEKIVTIPNAVALNLANPRNAESRHELENLFDSPPRLLVAAAGRLSPEKGFDVLVDAAAQVLRTSDDVGFLLFGEGPLREAISEQIQRYGIAERFVLAGFRKDLQTLLPNVDVLVMSSHTEGLPVILLEALAAAVPVVVTAVGGIPEVIEHGVQGFLVAPRDAKALAARVGQLLQNEEMRARMQAAGPERIATEYNTPLQAERYQALFTRLLAERDKT